MERVNLIQEIFQKEKKLLTEKTLKNFKTFCLFYLFYFFFNRKKTPIGDRFSFVISFQEKWVERKVKGSNSDLLPWPQENLDWFWCFGFLPNTLQILIKTLVIFSFLQYLLSLSNFEGFFFLHFFPLCYFQMICFNIWNKE